MEKQMTNNELEIQGEQGEQGIQGRRGEQGVPGNNALNSISSGEYLFLKAVFWLSLIVFMSMLSTIMFIAFYQFKTIDIQAPIKVMNVGLRVPLGGIVEMELTGEQFVDDIGVVVFTLMRKVEGQDTPIDSITWICSNKIGRFRLRRFFATHTGSFNLGKDCWIKVSIRYNLYGLRPILREFDTQKFEIYKP